MSSQKSKAVNQTLEQNQNQLSTQSGSEQHSSSWLCTPNPDRHQYGESFTVSKGSESEAGTFHVENGMADDKTSLSLDQNKKYFLKIPVTKNAGCYNEISHEISKEGHNKDDINNAKARLDNWNKTELGSVNKTLYVFEIVEMIGEITMVSNNNNDQALHGLVYKYVESIAQEGNPVKSLQLKDLNNKIGKDSKLFLQFARSFAYAIQKIHNQSIVHSFIVPRNIIPTVVATSVIGNEDNPNKIEIHPYTLVGFGYAKMGTSSGRSNNTLLLDDRSNEDRLYLAPEYKTPNEYGGHWFPADIYSVGAILYATLCYGLVTSASGNNLLEEDRVKLAEEARDKLAEEARDKLAKAERDTKQLIDSVLLEAPRDVLRLKKLIDINLDIAARTLIQENENILKIIDQCLRYNPEDRFSCAEELIEAIELAIEAETTPTSNSSNCDAENADIKTAYNILNELELNKILPKFLIDHEPANNTDNPVVLEGGAGCSSISSDCTNNVFLIGLMKERLDSFRGDRQKLQLGHFEVFGSRDKIISSLCRMLCSSDDNYEYHYWLSENLGPLGRFLTMNKHKARRGLKIKRLFLVDVENFQLLKADEQSMLLDHLKAQKDTNEYLRAKNENDADGFEVRVKFVESSDINSFEREGNTVGYLKPAGNSTSSINSLSLCLNFYSVTTSEWRYGKEYVSRKITKVRYMVPKQNQLNKFISKFNLNWEDAITLDTYINKGRFNSGDKEVDQFQMDKVDLRRLIS
jgi:serine/threonine protein kinase